MQFGVNSKYNSIENGDRMENPDGYQKEVIRLETIAEGLRDAGLSATTQDTGGDMLCLIVGRADHGQIVWGTADVNWGGAIEDSDGGFISGIPTDCPSDTEDVAEIVDALKQASISHGAIIVPA